MEEERIEIGRWKEQYQLIKNSIDGAAETAVAKQALKVVSMMDDIDNATNSFEGFLDAVLSQGDAHLTHHTTSAVSNTSGGDGRSTADQVVAVRSSTAIVPVGVAVEMGIQCDGVYSELEEDTRLVGMDAATMLKRCQQSQVPFLLVW